MTTTYPSDYPADYVIGQPVAGSNQHIMTVAARLNTVAARPMGWRPDLPDFRDWKLGPLSVAPPLPNSKMLAWVPGDPQTGNLFDQGNLGSCTANAVASALLYCRIKQRVNQGLAPSRLFNYYNARMLQGWEGWDSGAYIRDAIKVAAKFGSADEQQWPYDIARFAEKPPQWVYDAAYRHKSVAYYRLSHSLDEMKACLVDDFPFVFGFTVYSDFPWNSSDGVVNLPGKGSFAVGGHACLCIAFDDGQQRFHFANSWGKGWGRLGRGSLPYSYLTNPDLADDFWTIRLID